MVALACDVLKTVAIFGPHGELPDKKTDAEGWNEAWNRYLEWRFHPNPTLNNTSAPNRLLPLFEISDNPLTRKAWLAESKALSTVLLKKQVGMTDFIRDQWGSFALGWLSLGPEERSKHVLRTLIRLCDTFDFERSRFFCPESTTAFLERDSGRGLLDLVTPFAPLPNQTRKRDEPTFLFHPHYDCAMGYDQPCPVGRDPAIWDMIRNNNYCARSEFLCRMLFYIICDALGVEVPPVETRKLWAAKTEGREIYSRLPDSINAVDGFEKEVIGSLQEMQKKAVWVCTTCGRSEADLPQGNARFAIGSSAILLIKPYAASLLLYSLLLPSYPFALLNKPSVPPRKMYTQSHHPIRASFGPAISSAKLCTCKTNVGSSKSSRI